MLDKIKILLGITGDDKDELLLILISLCKDQATEYCNLDEYWALKCDIDDLTVL